MFATDLVTANGENGIRAFGLNFVRIRWQWMGFQPQRASEVGRLDTSVVPPCGFIARAMHFAMMSAAQRDRELIAHLATEARDCTKRRW